MLMYRFGEEVKTVPRINLTGDKIDLDKLLEDVETRREYKTRFQKERYDTLNVLLPKGAKKRLQEKALNEGMPLSEYVRKVLIGVLTGQITLSSQDKLS